MPRLSANEAAQLLGVSVPTLYAYVSRGLLRSLADGTSKRRHYDADEVRLLARRRADAKRAGKVAERTLDWGVPVLESRITQIANGTLRYRGRDAISLAMTATLEEAAALLWECPPARVHAAPGAERWFDTARWLGRLDRWRDRPRSSVRSRCCRPPRRTYPTYPTCPTRRPMAAARHRPPMPRRRGIAHHPIRPIRRLPPPNSTPDAATRSSTKPPCCCASRRPRSRHARRAPNPCIGSSPPHGD